MERKVLESVSRRENHIEAVKGVYKWDESLEVYEYADMSYMLLVTLLFLFLWNQIRLKMQSTYTSFSLEALRTY
jgi:hypothetical protein